MQSWIENGIKMVSYTAEELDTKVARGEAKTDWEAVKAMSDSEVGAAIAADPDATCWRNTGGLVVVAFIYALSRRYLCLQTPSTQWWHEHQHSIRP